MNSADNAANKGGVEAQGAGGLHASAVQPVGPRIGILGGTFDPPHLGHLVAASEAMTALALDRMMFVPTGWPWQKAGAGVSLSAHRSRMTELAIADDGRFEISRVDVDRAGPTYTLDTVRDLSAAAEPGTTWYFLLGADALASFPGWRHAREVAGLVTLVAVPRPGSVPTPLPWPEARLIELPMPTLDISSRGIRERVRRGASIRYLVPDAVGAYIGEHQLYVDLA